MTAPSTDTVQSATSTETLVRLLVAIARADDAVRKKHDLIFVQAADRLSTLQSELTRAREREKEAIERCAEIAKRHSQRALVYAETITAHRANETAIYRGRSDEAADIEKEIRALAGGKP